MSERVFTEWSLNQICSFQIRMETCMVPRIYNSLLYCR
uniref:Uncharacterized protein n=1 Tax=Anguilla anguilla TaxID=7936 RepID=A0A0E9S6Z6_ANGAN